MKLLALDLATTTGWAFGEPGGRPSSGSERLARAGSSVEVIGGALLKWSFNFIQAQQPDAIVWEAPLKLPHDTVDHLEINLGLPAIVGAVGNRLGVTMFRKASVQQVRLFFIGTANAKRDQAKELTMRRCRHFGFTPVDDNEADALAVWHYQAALMNPAVGTNITPLFGGGR